MPPATPPTITTFLPDPRSARCSVIGQSTVLPTRGLALRSPKPYDVDMTHGLTPVSTEDDTALRAVAEAFGTPLYVYDLDLVSAQVGRLRRAFPEAEPFYAVKANPCGAVLRHLAALGLGAGDGPARRIAIWSFRRLR